jgi:hypothetical protein
LEQNFGGNHTSVLDKDQQLQVTIVSRISVPDHTIPIKNRVVEEL